MYDQLANPFRKEEPGARRPAPPAGSTPREWVRLYVMGVVFLMTVGAMIYMRKISVPNPKKDKQTGEAIDYTLQGEPRKPRPGEGRDPSGEAAPVKKDIPVPPLPKDGIVDFRELAAPFQDGRQKPVKETPEFIGLLNVFLNSVTPESVTNRVNPNVTVDQAYLAPAKHRGEVLRAYGRLIYIYTERLDVTTPNNLEVVYLGILQEYPKNRTVYFYMAELPKDPKTGEPIKFQSHPWKGQTIYDDWVEVEGVFLRTYDYPGQKLSEQDPDPLTKSAVLFVKNLRLAHKPQYADHRAGFIFGVSALAAVVVAIVIVAGVMTRKYNTGSLRMKLFALKRAKGKDFPKPSPEKQILGDEIPKPAEPAVEPKSPPPP
jgi:hypothetical protein